MAFSEMQGNRLRSRDDLSFNTTSKRTALARAYHQPQRFSAITLLLQIQAASLTAFPGRPELTRCTGHRRSSLLDALVCKARFSSTNLSVAVDSALKDPTIRYPARVGGPTLQILRSA
jgi:hypothetical protein